MQMLKTILSPYPGNAEIALDGSTLRYRLDSIDDEATPIAADLAAIVADYSQDHGVIAVGERDDALFVVETTAISIGYRGSPLVDTHNTARRDSPLAVYRSLGGTSYPALFILTPRRGASLDECALYFFESSGLGEYPATRKSPAYSYGRVSIRVDGAPLVAQEVGLLPTYLPGWLPISLSGDRTVASGGSVALVVDAPEGTEVYLEALAGTLSRSRARRGDVVTLYATDLAPGTRARVKAGYKYWPGKADVEIEVV